MALVIKSKFNFSSYNLIKNVILDFGKCNPIKIDFGVDSMTKEIEKYFIEQYMKQYVRVLPGHWPDFKSKKEVDEWIYLINRVMKAMK